MNTLVGFKAIKGNAFVVFVNTETAKNQWFSLDDFGIYWNAMIKNPGKMIVYKKISEYNKVSKCMIFEKDKITIGIGAEGEVLQEGKRDFAESVTFELSKENLTFLAALAKNQENIDDFNKALKKDPIEIL